ncbi:hypothetical protein LAZ67_4002556 [Cordylochernes scorpioides]|uniref:Integrase catalytic domain-containing protein n=1 Tax=Cordylochernes scorpioides TaxID=51811 RepID=A0ABY6KDW6_9ARAC|nr:hypothetical protein LAZ67_4002556 [Cordylochernes scorpioides]
MPPATISEWTRPEKPWHRLHLDLADNGRQFVSGEFEQFTKMNGIRHTKTSPYNPSTNGLAERYVREFKNLLRKNNGKDDLEANLQSFLFAHRTFPQTVIKEFPGGTANEEKFKIKILEFNTKMGNPREVFHEAVRRQEQFTTGCEVYFRNYATGPKRCYIRAQLASHLVLAISTWRVVSVYGEECMSIQMVRRWRSWFLEGWQNVHDDERSGTPVTATDNAAVAVVRNVVEADRRVTIDEIIIRLPPGIEIRRSSIGTIMSDVLDFRKVCARWVARLLLENHKQQRMEAARVFLEMHQRDGDQLFSRIVTGDESWVHHSTPETKRQSMVWKKPEESAPKKAKVTISAGKVMAMENFKWEIFTHPPHSPELAPSDFHLYPALKWHLGGKHFANDDEVQAEANHWLLRQDTAWYNSGI